MAALRVRPALRTLGASAATWYRRQKPSALRAVSRRTPPLALSSSERQRVLDTLNSARFADCTPYTAFARLLDEGTYLASVRTFYRILSLAGSVRERRNQLVHPAHAKPELLATVPNQVSSWDITKLKGPAKWTCFHLYVILDIVSRCVVGWMLAQRESAELAEQLIADTIARQNIAPERSPCMPIVAPACAPSPSPRCSSTWKSPKRTAGRTSPTTTRTRNRSSRP